MLKETSIFRAYALSFIHTIVMIDYMTIAPCLQPVRSALFRAQSSCLPGAHAQSRGATLVEFVIVAPLLLFISLILIQHSLLFHARSTISYALFEGARSGSVSNAAPEAIESAFTRAMAGYHGGGRNSAELARAHLRAQTERSFVRIEILSPDRASFDALHSPELAARLGISGRVIPNENIAFLDCPLDRPSCKADASARTFSLLNANLLRLRVTYGVAPEQQIPLAGRFMNAALALTNAADGDRFKKMLIDRGRIPLVSEVTMRMQSPAIESTASHRTDSAAIDSTISPVTDLPLCPITQPACSTAEPGAVTSDESDEDRTGNDDVAEDDSCHPLLDPGCEPVERCVAPAEWLAGNSP